MPLCGSNCTNGPYHLPECQIFSQILPTNFQFRINLEDKKWENNNSPSSEYSCITPIRALELKKNNPEMWSRLLLLMDADEDRKIDKEHREMLQVRLLEYIRFTHTFPSSQSMARANLNTSKFFLTSTTTSKSIPNMECVSTSAAGAQTPRFLGHRALQDAPAHADPNS